MSDCLVFVPITSSERASVAAGAELTDRRAFRVTPELMAMLGYGADETEDAEYAAMVLASVAGLTMFGHRLVLVAGIDPRSFGAEIDAENGEFRLPRLPAQAVEAFFADADDADTSNAAAACRGLSIDEAWELDQVQQLLADADLLWHGREELGQGPTGDETALPDVLRLSFDEPDDAAATAEAIADAGHEVALIKERFAGEDDDEAIIHVVATPASLDEVRALIVGDYFVD